ncbi:MAG TPA: alpha/beta hydrolase [Polyangiaceae bacterium]|jgi:alpha-beta hydrolase superfamily lysophospholipase
MNRVSNTLTDDGWRIALHVYEPTGATTRRHPVVLCHGLASNHLGFDTHADTSLSRHLAGRGYVVFALDLRGHGHSEHPTRGGARRFGWSFDDYLLHDVPAAIEYARRASGASAVHWVGHSMGGLLAYAHLARGGSRDLCSVTAIGSSLDYSGAASGFHALLPLLSLLDHVPFVPIGLLGRVTAGLVGRVETPFQRFNVWRSNVDPEHWRRVSRRGFHAVSPPVMAQLASAMQPGGLRSRDGSTAYLEGLARATAPVLAIAGDRDAQCPPEAAERTLAALGSSRRELRVFGPEQGHADHYGHFDLIIGRRARAEVFPSIDAWIDAADGGEAVGAPSPLGHD